jgi:hypothetical protein
MERIDRKELLKLARVLTLLSKQKGQPATYLRTVDLLANAAPQGREPADPVQSETGSRPRPQHGARVSYSVLRRMLGGVNDATGATLKAMDTLKALAAPGSVPPLVLWPEGPASGVYVTPSWKSAQAAIVRYTAATHSALSFTDWARFAQGPMVDLQPSQDYTRLYLRHSRHYREPSGIFSARLVNEASGTLIVIGPIPFSQHELFESAQKLHEGCLLANECGHRVIAVIQTPRPRELSRDLERALEIPEYYDHDYVRAALRGIVEPDGHLIAGFPADWNLPDETNVEGLTKNGFSWGLQGEAACVTHEPQNGVDSSNSPIRPPAEPSEAETDVHWEALASGESEIAKDTRSWREAVWATSATFARQALAAPPGLTEAARSVLLRSPVPSEAVPAHLMRLLEEAVTRRDTGLLMVGGLQESFERTLLLAEVLAATEAVGPAALVLPAYRLDGAERYLRIQECADGTQRVRSRCYPQLPLFPSVESAYEKGYRRIAMEYECEPYHPVASEIVRRHAQDVCFIVCINGIGAQDAFAYLTSADWGTLECLIGVLTWVRFQGAHAPLALCDAFVPGDQAINPKLYERAADALYACRQLEWEAQALKLLDSSSVSALELRQYLLAWDVLEGDDSELMQQTQRVEGLRVWLIEKLLAGREPSDSLARTIRRRYN